MQAGAEQREGGGGIGLHIIICNMVCMSRGVAQSVLHGGGHGKERHAQRCTSLLGKHAS